METKTNSGATEILRIPEDGATCPNLMGNLQPSYPSLTIVKGPQIGETFLLDQQEITIGRDPKNSVFLNDMTVSRKHACILVDQISREVSIQDLQSLNGTWVDGAIITKSSLHDGSTIQIGTFRMVYHTNQSPMRISTQ